MQAAKDTFLKTLASPACGGEPGADGDAGRCLASGGNGGGE